MSISVKDMIDSFSLEIKSKITLVAGKNGLNKTDIFWCSSLEECEFEKKYTNQIILTTGINLKDPSELLIMAENLVSVSARAFFVLIGKHIKKIPPELEDFCNKNELPLFAVSSDIFISDVIRELAHVLIHNEKRQLNIEEIMQSITFSTENLSTQVSKLSVYNISESSYFCPIIIKLDNDNISDPNMVIKGIKLCCEKAVERSSGQAVTFLYNRLLVVIFIYDEKDAINTFIKTLTYNLPSSCYYESKIHICIGKLNDTIYNLSANFKKLLPMMNVSVKYDIPIIHYNDMKMYKYITELSDIDVLMKIYNESVGKLVRYDSENNTDLTNYITTYIQCNANVQLCAEKLFVHRNTVNNQLHKIDDITGINPLTLEGKLMFFMAIKISDLYNPI